MSINRRMGLIDLGASQPTRLELAHQSVLCLGDGQIANCDLLRS